MMSSAAGIMLASTFFSLLLPALEYGQQYSYLILTCGFACGGLLIVLTDILIGKLNAFSDGRNKKCAVMVIAVTAHNVPEGLAIGVAFGAIGAGGVVEGVGGAYACRGNRHTELPRGYVRCVPLRANGMSRLKSFVIGQLSGAVEIVAGVVGALAVALINNILPFALSFSAGAMLAVRMLRTHSRKFRKRQTARNTRHNIRVRTYDGARYRLRLNIFLRFQSKYSYEHCGKK